MKIDKRKLLGFIIGILLFSAFVTSLSFAYYKWKSDNTDVGFVISDSYFYCESEIEMVTNSLAPVLDYRNGSVQKFKVNNIGKQDTTFSVSLNITNIDSPLKSTSFKYKLVVDTTGGSNNCVTSSSCSEVENGSGDFSNVKVGMNTLVSSVSLPNNSRYEYYLFMYIDGSVENDVAMQGSEMTSTLGVCEVVAYLDANGGSVSPDFIKLVAGTEKYPTIPTPTRSNSVVTYNYNNATGGNSTASDTVSYTFNGWYKDTDTSYTNKIVEGSNLTDTTNHTLKARWTASKSVTLPTPTRTGYTFGGWYSDSSFNNKVGNAGATYNPSKSITLYAKWTANSYTISYTLNGGTKGSNAPASGAYDSDVQISNPTKTVTVTGNANSTGATVGSATSKAQTFAGWTSNSSAGLGSNAKTGASANPSTSWTGSATTNTYFKNLRDSSGTVTLTATWTAVAFNLPTVTKTGYTCKWNTKSDGSGTNYNSGASYTPSTTSASSITMYAVCSANSYTIAYTLNGGTKGSNAPDSGTYDSDVQISNPTKTVTVTGNVNSTGATVGSATSKAQTFAGWTSNSSAGLGSNAKTGTSASPSTSWSGSATTNTYFKNLRDSSGTVTLTATWTAVAFNLPTVTKTGYTCKWNTKSDGSGTNYNSGASYTPSATSASSITLYAVCSPNSYTVNYYVGNGSSTAGSTKLSSTTTCSYNSTCTLKSFSNLGGIFPYSSAANSANSSITNYNWSFYGWSTSQTGTSRAYADGASFTYSSTSDINLYAIGSKPFYFYSGTTPSKIGDTLYQYWNPYSTSTSYLTSITIPTQTNITSWNFIGYVAGSNSASSTVTFSSDKVGTSVTPSYSTWGTNRSVYSRTLTLAYNGNGSTGGSTASTTATQYYNSGYDSSTKTISTPTFTLASNGFTKTGHTFSKWAAGSTSGTQYAAGASYNGFSPAVDNTTTTQNMYAIWTANKYTVTYDYSTNGGTSATKTTASVAYGSSVDLTPTATKSGWTFVGWNTNKDATSKLDSLTMSTSNITLYAIYKKTGQVTFNLNGNTSFTYSGTKYTETTSIDLCTMYNTATTCTASITMPTIEASTNTQDVIGWSNASDNHKATYTSGQTGVTLTSGTTWYAQTKKDEVTLNASFNANGATLSSTTAQSCTLAITYNGTAQDTSCTVTAPTITRSGYTIVGFNTSASSTSNNSSYSSSTGKITLTGSNTGATWYAITYKKLTATFYYYNSGIKNTSATCNMYNTATSCSATVPTSTFNSTTAQYGGTYLGYGSVNTMGTNTSSSVSISQDTSYYVSYSKKVTEYYQNTSRNIYRNEYFTSASAMGTVLSTSNTSTSKISTASYTPSSITWSWHGYATSSSSSSRAYSSVDGAAQSTTTALYTLYSRSVTATFYYYNGSAQATTTASGTQLANYQASVVSNGSISIPSAVTSSTGPNNVSYSGLSTSTSSTTTTTTINTSQTKYYAIYVADYTASFTKENSNVSSIGSTSLSCSSKATTNGTTYSSTACSITLPSITPATGYIALGWYNSSGTLVGQSGSSITITSNQSYTAKAKRLTASDFSYDNTDTGVDCTDVQCMIDKLDIPMADQFSYDNSETGVDCSDIQCMIDKLDENAGG